MEGGNTSMSTVDNRIVNMQFNNREFESRVKTSIHTLDNLKKSLNLDESAKSLENLEKAGKRFSIAGMADGVDKIASKFSVLGIMGVTALQNITNTAVNAGKQIVSALTIDPIKMGFSEYETQINAVQTILANTSSKGTTLTDVNAALDELNAYADKTIYNFTEMTRNIGTFTAAGVDLDTSVQAIKGIANLAAVSGSTSQQASTAMYQLSQALASGTVKLMDWNSVVNAGMGGQVFQDAIKETARLHGVNIDQMIKNEGSFRETLKDGWLTSEILTETLAKFTGDLNEEQLKTMGYTKEQIASIMEMGQMANDAATKVKTFTQLFDTLKEAAQSGWTQSWEIIVGDFEEAKELLTEVSDVFGGIIGASADARNEMLKGWKDLGGRASLIEAVRNAFHGILDVIAPVKEAFNEIFPAMTGQQLFNLTEGLKKLTEQFKIGETTAANLKSTFKGVFALLDIGVMAIKALAKGAFDLVGAILPVGDGLLGITGGIGEFVVGLRDSLKAGDGFNKMVTGITDVLKIAIGWIEGLVNAINESFKGFGDVDTSGLDALSNKVQVRFAPFEALGNAIKWVFDGIVGVVQKAIPIAARFASLVGEAFGGLTDTITNAINSGDFSQVLDIVNTGLLGGLIYGIKKFVDALSGITENAGGFLEAITGILDGVKGSLEAYQSTLKAKTLITIAGALGILAASLVALSLIDSEKLTGALGAMTAMFVELFASMAIFEKIMGSAGFKNMGKMAVGMIGLSTAVLILSNALQNIGSLDLGQILKGLGGIAALVAILAKTADVMGKNEKAMIKGAGQMVLLSGALVILSGALKIIGSMQLGELGIALLGVAGGLTAMVVALKVLSSVKGFVKGAASLLVLSVALNALATSLKIIGSMSWEELKTGMIGLGVGLGAMTVALAALSFLGPSTIAGAAALAILSGALIALGAALKIMGSMNMTELGTALGAMAASLGIMVIALGALALLGPATLIGAGAIAVLSASLLLLAPALKILGSMTLPELGMALLTLASSLLVLGGLSALLAPLTPVILALGAAFALFGVAVAAIGGGILALSVGLSGLAVAGTAGAAALVVVVTSLLGLIPMALQMLGEGIIAFAKVITDGAPAIAEAVKALVLGIVDILVTCIPAIGEAFAKILLGALQTIASYMPDMIQAGFDILIGFLKGVRDNIGEVVTVAIDIVIEFLGALGDKWKDVVDAGFELIIDFINGLADSVEKNMPRIVDAIWNLGEAIITGLKNSILLSKDRAWQAIKDIAQGLIDSFKEKLGIVANGCKAFKDMAADIISGLINGIKEKIQNVKDAAADLGNSIVSSVKNFLGIQSPSKVMRDEVGVWVVKGLAEGIKKDMSAEEAAAQKAKNIINAFKTELDKFDLDASTADLEYQLWTALKGDKATDAEKAQMEADTLARKLQIQAEKVELAQGEYTVTVQKLGEDSEAAQEAYNKYLKSQIELAELSTKLTELQETELKRQQDAQKEYYKYITDNMNLVKDGWLTYDEVAKSATELTGYDPKELKKDMKEEVKEATTEAMASVQEVYTTASKDTFGSLTTNFSEWGASYSDSLAKGIQDKSPTVVATATTVMNNTTTKLKELQPSWVQAGSYLVEGFVKGMEDKIDSAAQTAARMAREALAAAQAELEINSPSLAFAEIGGYVSQGFANGISGGAGGAKSAASNMVGGTIKFIRDAYEKAAGLLSSLSDDPPTITPVVDLSNVESASESISKSLSGSTTINTSKSSDKASSSSGSFNFREASKKANEEKNSSGGATYNYTQNNYSPKSLSTSEIYRQTKSQFSAWKRLVTNE